LDDPGQSAPSRFSRTAPPDCSKRDANLGTEADSCRLSDTARYIQYKVQKASGAPRRRRCALTRFPNGPVPALPRACENSASTDIGWHDRHVIDLTSAEPKGAAMPLYSYHCAKCAGDVELLVGSSEAPVCPTCGSKKLERLVSRTAPEGKSRSIIKAARSQAARAGHLSNFSRSERRR